MVSAIQRPVPLDETCRVSVVLFEADDDCKVFEVELDTIIKLG